MSRQGRRDTAAELAVRRALHRRGLRYRLCVPVPGLPRRTMDIAFGRARVAVFVHGCFWHGCEAHGTWPQANSAWWRTKLERNVERDAETAAHLVALGWKVVTVWEHEPPEDAAARVEKVLAARSCETRVGEGS